MTDITQIPLGKLVASEDNVRRTAATDASLQELAASIAAHGLLQSLVVRKHRKGKFAVVAARFGVTEAVVSKRLRLAHLSPALMEAYRGDRLLLAQVMAFTVSDDHALQDRVFENLSQWNDDPRSIRDALTEHEIAATDRRVRFVTLAAYEQAGGGVRRDLFCEDDSGVYILDDDILDRLAGEKLEAEAGAVRAEGWKWVETRPSFDYDEWSGYIRRHEEPVPLSVEDQEKLDALCSEYDRIQDSDSDEQAEARLEDLSQQIKALEERETFWPPETLAVAGAVVCIDDDGELDVRRGFVTPADAAAHAEADDDADGGDDADGSDDDVAAAGHGLPCSLVESLTTHRTAALGAALSQNARVALAVVVHALALKAFYGYRGESCVEIFSKQSSLKLAEGSTARALLETATEIWGQHLPGNADKLFAWCLEQSQDRLLDLLAHCAALTVNAVQVKSDRPNGERFAHAPRAGAGPRSRNGYMVHADSREFLRQAHEDRHRRRPREVKRNAIAPAWLKAKKADLASIVEREIAETGWLPAQLRRAA